MKYLIFLIFCLIYYTIQIKVNVEIGNPSQELTVIVDTTSGMSYIPVSSNETNTLIPNINTKITNQEISIYNNIIGNLTYDILNMGNINANISFVEYQYMPNRLGVLGFGYNHKYNQNYSLINTLYNSGVIGKRVFSLGKDDLIIGINDYKNYTTCNLTSNEGLTEEYREGWICDIDYLTHGKGIFTNGENIDARVVFDSNYDYISMPAKYIQFFKNYLVYNYGREDLCHIIQNNVNETSFICINTDTSNFTDIYLVIEENGYNIPASVIFKKSNLNSTHSHLLINFIDDEEEIITLGKPFFEEYTLIFDYDEKKVGFVGKTINLKEEIGNWQNDFSEQANKFFYLMVFATIFGSLLFIIIVMLIIRSIKRRRIEEHGPLINSD